MSIQGKTTQFNKISENFYEPYTKWPKLAKHFLKLPAEYNFDLEKLRAEFGCLNFNELLKPLAISSDKTRLMRSYKGMGLTTKKNSIDPIYDAFSMYDELGRFSSSSRYLSESDEMRNRSPEVEIKHRNFTEKNKYFSEYLNDVVGAFKSPMGKVRLMQLMPGGRIAPHVDFPYYEEVRIHACIFTNDNVWWEVNGDRFQIPADGSFYWFDAGEPHSVWNDGKDPRLVLSIHLSPFFDIHGNILREPSDNLLELIQNAKI